MTFGKKLKQIRLERGLSQDEFANILGTSKQVISRYETEQRTPKITVAQDYAKRLGLPFNYLIDDSYDTVADSDFITEGKKPIKEIIKNRRIELGLTMLEVAKAVGVSEATVSRWESGDIENMRRDKIVALAKVLRLSPSVIMEWEEDDNNNDFNELSNVYLSFAKEAQDDGIDPHDIKIALEAIKRIRRQGDE